ncbi:MAG: cell envelope integrity protein CreD [Bacteroidota bacterium]
MNTENTTSIITRFSNWLRESVMVKLFSITVLILFLLIPQSWVHSIIEERQGRLKEVMTEVSEKWSYAQDVTGPVLVVPYNKQTTTHVIISGKTEERITTTVEEAYFLPEELNINSEIKPETLHRGLFDAIVYNSGITMNGFFVKPDFAALNIPQSDILWKDAYVMLGLSDLRGIGEKPVISINGKQYKTEPSSNLAASLFDRNIAGKVTVSPNDSLLSFNVTLSLKGSSYLYFYPMGKSTRVAMSGNWGNPSFDGAYLPQNRTVTRDSFAADWNVLNFNRPFPQQWLGTSTTLASTAFGVKLLLPVDQYQQSTRSAKYGVLIILLTFVSLLLIELIVKINIHPFQYSLIGVALVIYYALLISFSEHIGFNLAYLLSATAIIVLISTYSYSIFKSVKVSALLSVLLTTFYGYIYIITQEQDYALLLGSVGLFIIIATLMYVSRSINWYNPKKMPDSE